MLQLQKFSFAVFTLFVFAFIIVKAGDETSEKVDKKPGDGDGTVAERTKLLESLLDGYNKKVNPDKTTAKFGVALINLGVNEEKSLLESYVWHRIVWNDNRLKWEPKDHGGIGILRLDSNDIWKPDITLYNSGVDWPKCWQTNALIYPSGEVLWVPPCKLNSMCHYTLRKEPYGEQVCSLKFGSWTYDGNVLDMQFYNNDTSMDMSDIENSSGFEIVSTNGQRNVRHYSCCAEPYVDLTYNITLKRIPGEELVKRH